MDVAACMEPGSDTLAGAASMPLQPPCAPTAAWEQVSRLLAEPDAPHALLLTRPLSAHQARACMAGAFGPEQLCSTGLPSGYVA